MCHPTTSASGGTDGAGGSGGSGACGGGPDGPGRNGSVGRFGEPEESALVAGLLARMSVEEKFGQLQQLAWTGATGPGGGQNDLAERAARDGRLGSVLNLYGAAHTNALQRSAVEESRLGIPLLFGFDVIHGFWTTFPIPLAQAASFDPDVAVADARVSASEARRNGVHWTFSPMVDVTREPRWGRVAESSGEDPCVTARFAAAKVRGYQGPDPYDLSGPDRLAACAKHFAAYGAVEGGRDYNTVDSSWQRLRNVYLPPFRAAVEAGAATVMAAFNTVSGIPAHAHPGLLTGVLKDEWGFEGVVVSDWNGVHELVVHGFAADGADAGRQALAAGLDMEMASTHLAAHGPRLLADGAVTGNRLDDAVARVLRLKYRLGLFDRPYTDEAATPYEPTTRTRAMARHAAARCAVLLKNDGSVLPLDRGTGTVAVVGPYADSNDLHGTWSGPGGTRFPATSVLDALRAAAPSVRFRHAFDGPDAVAAARAAEVTLVVVGEASSLSGEASSRSDLRLPAGQAELITAVAATGRPFAVVVAAGRPLVVEEWIDRVPAVLLAWHGGIEAGPALADLLLGDVPPGGKLPVTVPRSVGQLPLYYAHENTGRPAAPDRPHQPFVSGYLDTEHGPRFPFGHGLSYTEFTISGPTCATRETPVAELAAGRRIEVTATVTNVGERTGDEVVQLYVRDPVASVVQPVRRLCGFERVTLKPRESAPVLFSLGAEELGFLAADDGALVVEPGLIDVYVGNDAHATAHLSLTLTG